MVVRLATLVAMSIIKARGRGEQLRVFLPKHAMARSETTVFRGEQPMHPAIQAIFARPNRQIMVFVDGENLIFRYQEMLGLGYVPREDNLFHVPDVAVWSPTFTQLAQHHEILRVTYYTYAGGDETRLASI